jgi:serine/threonine-protein kinase
MLDKGSVVTLSVAVPIKAAVPPVVGRSEAEAEAALNEAGFKWQIQTQPSDKAAKGTVIGTAPAPGQSADKGSLVSLLVAVPITVVVPAVVGRPEAAAEAALQRAGLKWQRQTEASDTAAPGNVLAAEPAPGQSADKGSVVSLLVAVPVSVPVPALVGQTVADAVAALGRVGLKWQRQDVPTDAAAPGQVVATEPAAAQPVDKGSTVMLRVAAAAAVAVPRVAGEKSAEATAALGRAGFMVQRKDVASNKVPPGRVIGTAPAAGQTARKGATVTVLVARAVAAARPAAVNTAPRYAPNSEPAPTSPGYAPAPPPSYVARDPGGYSNPAWGGGPRPAPAPNPYSGAYGGHVEQGPGPTWLQQTGPLSGGDLVGHLYDNAHR